MTTASVFKISILAKTLLRAQAEGRGLTQRERSLLEPMIRRSADPPANQLFSELGGASAFNQYFAMIGMSESHTPGSVWGLTSTSAHDQVIQIETLLLGLGGFISEQSADEAFALMTTVDPSQRWGVSAGVPSGGVVALKNGFFPSSSFGWRINTAGFVRSSPSDAGHVLAVLSDRWPSDTPGIRAVEDVSRHVNSLLLGPVGSDVPPGAVPVAGDWDGDGFDTPGFVVGGKWYLRDRSFEGPATRVFTFGRAGDVPVAGDWDHDGRDEPGVVRGRHWFLRSTTAGGAADHELSFGRDGDVPVLGDWNGDGRDTPGVVRGAAWYLSDGLGGGAAARQFAFGRPGDIPVAGDWDGDDRDEPGIVRGARWFVKHTASSGPADVTFAYGRAGDDFIAGGWRAEAHDGPGLVRGDRWYLRNRPSSGPADRNFAFGR